MSEYTPTTEGIRTAWTHGYHGDNYPDAKNSDAEFDRWLAAHDAEVRAEQREVDAQIAESQGIIGNHLEPYWEGRDDASEAIADEIRKSRLTIDECTAVVPEEPEWEYGRLIGDAPYQWLLGSSASASATHKRTKAVPAGPWLPVEQGGE